MRTRRAVALATAACLALGTLSACGSGDDGDSGGKVSLRFLSLAWQKESVKANKQIVATWNSSHPKIHVKYVQGSWDNVHDQLVSAFEGNSADDIIHDAADDLAGFADQGYLADLTNLRPADLKSDIPPQSWNTTKFGSGGIYGVPFLQEPRLFIANKKLLDAAGVTIPTADHPWTWDDLAAASKKLTKGKTVGMAWPMSSPVSLILNLSMNYGGKYFYKQGDKDVVKFGAAEQHVPKFIHDQVNVSHTASKTALGMSGSDVLPGFFAGKYAIVALGMSYRQQVAQQAPKNFDWVTLPPVSGDTAHQGVSPQTLSIAQQSDHKKQAMQFIDYFLGTQNQVRLARGDWMLPTGTKALASPKLQVAKDGWKVGASAGKDLVAEPAQAAKSYSEWKAKIAKPAFQQYLAGKITMAQLTGKLVTDGNKIVSRGQ